MMATYNRIQQRLNDDIADIPLFHGNKNIDTIKPATYVERIKQGISSLAWMQAQAFTYFKNSIKSSTANWLDTWLSFNRNAAQDKAFGDKSDPMVFANTMFNIKLSNYISDFYNFSVAITKMMGLHTGKFLASQLVLLDGHSFTNAQQLLFKNGIDSAYHEVYGKFTK